MRQRLERVAEKPQSPLLPPTLFHALAWRNVSHGRITRSACSIDINTKRPSAIATASLDLLFGPLCQARHEPTRTKDPSSSSSLSTPRAAMPI